jgi:uncharacterized membrane protein
MTAPILYCGDTELNSAASYLAGLMTHFGWGFDYVRSDQKVSRETLDRAHSLLILSDYPAAQFDTDLQGIAAGQVAAGMGLLMIGGWESFHGFGGNWDGTPLGQLLPVEIQGQDDRVNFDQPALLHPTDWKRGPFGLPWGDRPPSIGGLNRLSAKSGSSVELCVTPFRPRYFSDSGEIHWHESGDRFPALVTSDHGQGRVAAFASDVAPHWVGGFVDWGPGRVSAQAAGAPAIEVGSLYATFWKQLLSWTARLG